MAHQYVSFDLEVIGLCFGIARHEERWRTTQQRISPLKKATLLMSELVAYGRLQGELYRDQGKENRFVLLRLHMWPQAQHGPISIRILMSGILNNDPVII